MRYTDVSVSEINELTIGYFFPADNPGAATMEKLDPRNFLSDRVKRIEIGGWNMYADALTTINVSAYAGRIKGFFIPLVFDDDFANDPSTGYAYTASAIWDSYIMNDTNEVAKITGTMDTAFGSAITPVAHGFIDVTGVKGSCALYSSYVAGLDFTVSKVGQKFTVTFTPSPGINATNAIVVINQSTASGAPQMEEHYMITDGFEVDWSSACSFYYTVYYSQAAAPSGNQYGNHSHTQASQTIAANTNLQVFAVVGRYNPASDLIELTHNYHGQLTTGSTTFGAITKTLNSSSLTKFRDNGVNRGNIYLFLDYPANPY